MGDPGGSDTVGGYGSAGEIRKLLNCGEIGKANVTVMRVYFHLLPPMVEGEYVKQPKGAGAFASIGPCAPLRRIAPSR
jgi:hypothetical protein